MEMTRIGSLFSGYSGLDGAVRNVFGGELAWVSDIDPGACKILAHHYPDVPNLGDITTVDWDSVEPVDIITGGFPCQDVSMAGRRKGMGPGTRSGLWSAMCHAVDRLRPSLMVAENVRGLLSADGHADMEPCPWCMGNPGDEPPLRALGGVLGDLADCGYDAAWYGLTASSVGAPHGRFRIFIIAWPQSGNTDSSHSHGRTTAGLEGQAGSPVGSPGHPESSGRNHAYAPEWSGERERAPGGSGFNATDAQGVGWPEGGSQPDGHDGPANGAGAGEPSGGRGVQLHGLDESRAETTSNPESVVRPDQPLGGDAAGFPLGAVVGPSGGDRAGNPATRVRQLGEPAPVVAWGQFEPAIRRWEHLTRPAPAPTETGAKGGQRLSPRFVEWMQGLPDGHVTAPEIGLTRNEQLKALGNGVVVQQAEAALRYLLSAVAA